MSGREEISVSNSWLGSPSDGDQHDGWNNLTVLSERRAFVLYTAIRGGRKYVIKALRDEYATDGNYRRWLEKECRIGLEIDHPGVVRVEGLRRIPQISVSPVLVMEWIDGVGLSAFLAGKPSKEARRRVAAELADALEYIHSMGICHRDLKPDNIMVTRRGGHARIIDFGLGDAESFIELKSSRGTRRYGAPEQLTDDMQDVDSRADVWSYGRLLADMHCGAGYGRLARRCMRRQRDRRPTMTDVVHRLEKLQRGRSGLWAAFAISVIATMALAWGFMGGERGERKVMTDTVTIVTTDSTPVVAAPVRVDTVHVASAPMPDNSTPEKVKIVEITENEAGVDEIVERSYRKFRAIIGKYKERFDKDYMEGNMDDLNDLLTHYNREYTQLTDELTAELTALGLSDRRLSEIQAGFTHRVAMNGLLKDIPKKE